MTTPDFDLWGITETQTLILSERGIFKDDRFKPFKGVIDDLSYEEKDQFLVGELPCPYSVPKSKRCVYQFIQQRMRDFHYFFTPMIFDEKKYLNLFDVVMDFVLAGHAVNVLACDSEPRREEFIAEFRIPVGADFTKEELREYLDDMANQEGKMNDPFLSLEYLKRLPKALFKKYPKSAATFSVAAASITVTKLSSVGIIPSSLKYLGKLCPRNISFQELIQRPTLRSGVACLLIATTLRNTYVYWQTLSHLTDHAPELDDLQSKLKGIETKFQEILKKGYESLSELNGLLKELSEIIERLNSIRRDLEIQIKDLNSIAKMSLGTGLAAVATAVLCPGVRIGMSIVAAVNGGISTHTHLRKWERQKKLKMCHELIEKAQNLAKEIEKHRDLMELNPIEQYVPSPVARAMIDAVAESMVAQG